MNRTSCRCPALMLGVLVVLLGADRRLVSQANPGQRESRLSNLKQLTMTGENAEAYFSPDGRQLIFQSNPGQSSPGSCDQIFTMRIDGTNVRPIVTRRPLRGRS